MTLSLLNRRTLCGLSFCALAWLGLAQAAIAQDAPRVKFVTNAGEFVVELYPDKAPKTVENFLQYVKDKHYNGTIFHRVIPNFMVQGGGFTPDMKQKDTRAPVEIESKNGLKNDKYTLAMARTNAPHSATSQFFINVADNYFLDQKHTVFGRVVSGMDVVNKIKGVRTANFGGHGDVPTSPIVIERATILIE